MTTMQAALAGFVSKVPMVAEHAAITKAKGWTHGQKFIKEQKRLAALEYNYGDTTRWDTGRMAKFW